MQPSLKELGYNVGGFNAYIASDVLGGSGLSSSACIEVLLGTILNYLYNDGQIDVQQLAMIGQYAENVTLANLVASWTKWHVLLAVLLLSILKIQKSP